MRDLPPLTFLPELSHKLREVGQLWASSKYRPRVHDEVKHHWDELIDSWADSNLPLVIRKSSGLRGGTVAHSGGRSIISADNSPAQWAFMRAFQGFTYSLEEIKTQLESSRIPFAFATKRSEKSQMKYKGTLSAADNLNKRGWKLCHIDGVGLRSATLLEDFKIDLLLKHFRLLLKPSNHFLVPLDWAGLGELPEVIDEVRKYELGTTLSPSPKKKLPHVHLVPGVRPHRPYVAETTHKQIHGLTAARNSARVHCTQNATDSSSNCTNPCWNEVSYFV